MTPGDSANKYSYLLYRACSICQQQMRIIASTAFGPQELTWEHAQKETRAQWLVKRECKQVPTIKKDRRCPFVFVFIVKCSETAIQKVAGLIWAFWEQLAPSPHVNVIILPHRKAIVICFCQKSNGNASGLYIRGRTGSCIRAEQCKSPYAGPNFTQSTKPLCVKPLLFLKSSFKGAAGLRIKTWTSLTEAHNFISHWMELASGPTLQSGFKRF